jgi:hypothetical protein
MDDAKGIIAHSLQNGRTRLSGACVFRLQGKTALLSGGEQQPILSTWVGFEDITFFFDRLIFSEKVLFIYSN